MRLIDADALLEYLHDNHYASILEMCMKPIIEKQPTAYDVEKVAEELVDKSFDTRLKDDHGELFDVSVVDLETAIEIVLNGGKG